MSVFVFIIEDWWNSAGGCYHQAQARNKSLCSALLSKTNGCVACMGNLKLIIHAMQGRIGRKGTGKRGISISPSVSDIIKQIASTIFIKNISDACRNTLAVNARRAQAEKLIRLFKNLLSSRTVNNNIRTL